MTLNFFKHFVKSPVGLAFTIVGGSCSYVGSSYYLSSRRAADDHDDDDDDDEWKQRRSNLLFQDDNDDYQPPNRPVLSWTMQPVMYSESPVSASAGDDNNNNNITLWKPPSRQDLLNRLKGFGADGKTPLPEKDAEYDVLIIGGGATGAGCAVDAASRGLRTACVERDDFASGTSSKSTKLVHGGVRYLEKAFWNLDIEQYKLVAEALSERTTLLKIAPYLAYPLPIMLPIYKWYMVPYYWCGAKAYDLIAGSKNLATSYFLDATKALEAFPMIKQEDLVGAVVYYDGAQNDARMNVALALTAIQQGATVVNHTEVVSLLKEEVAGKEKPQLCGAILRDRLTGETWSVRAKCKKMDNQECKEICAPSSGVHLVLPDYFSPRGMGLLDPATSDGRVIFFLPWQGVTIAGTTDEACKVTDQPMPTQKEIDWILREVGHYLGPDVKVRPSDVLAAWSGIRPLVRDPNAKDTQGLVRNHMIHLSDSGLLTIAGGKWTTYRNMAQETIDLLCKSFDLKPPRPCMTENLMLIGSHGYSKTMYIKLIQQYGIANDVAKHLMQNYGDRAYSVAALTESTNKRWPLFGRKLANGYPFLEAEVKHAVRYEYAQTAADVMGRRMRLAFLDCRASLDALPRVIHIMADELGWSTERADAEYAAGKAYLDTMGLPFMQKLGLAGPSNISGTDFTREELSLFRSEFRSFDVNEDGFISVDDLRVVLRKMGARVATEEFRQIFHEIDLNRNGIVEFSEFLEVMSAVKDIKHQSKLAQIIASQSDPGHQHEDERDDNNSNNSNSSTVATAASPVLPKKK